MAGRPRKATNVIPYGLHKSQAVKVTSHEFKGIKLGLVVDRCKYDEGVNIWLTGESTPEKSVYACINPANGDTIESVEL